MYFKGIAVFIDGSERLIYFLIIGGFTMVCGGRRRGRFVVVDVVDVI